MKCGGSLLCLGFVGALALGGGCKAGGGGGWGETICDDGADNDGDGAADCDDTDCAQACGLICGDGTCEGSETAANCPADCTGSPTCGDSSCDTGEDFGSCPGDCATCGNSSCDAGETQANCPGDCSSNPVCGDTSCGAGENRTNCPQDCAVCGDGFCDAPHETEVGCAADCGPQLCDTVASILAQVGCAANESCNYNIDSDLIECRAVGSVPAYDQCGADADCQANANCLRIECETSFCLPYCSISGPGSCLGGGVCEIDLALTDLGLCNPYPNCNPVTNGGCPGGLNCYLGDGFNFCSPAATAAGQPGGACAGSGINGCVAGASCLFDGTAKCFEMCELAGGTGCSAGSCQSFGDPTWGICE